MGKVNGDKGQTTTEYVLILAVVVTLFVTLVKTLNPVISQFQNNIANLVLGRIFDPNKMHSFPIR